MEKKRDITLLFAGKTHERLLQAAILLLAVAAGLRLWLEFSRLLFDWGPTGAIDLKRRYNEVHNWFAGVIEYDGLHARYPPATYALLWPFLGWLPLREARWLWGATSLMALLWLSHVILRESGAQNRAEKIFIGLIPFAMNATGVTIGNGQLTLHVLAPLLAGIFMLPHAGTERSSQLKMTVLLCAAMAKPTITVPFLLLLLVREKLLAALLISALYAGITLFGTAFQPTGLFELFYNWIVGSLKDPEAVEQGYANLQTWLFFLHKQEWILPTTILALGAFSIWLYFHRRVDLWLLVAVTALFSRFWTYHRVYDDLLILFPIVALFRIARMERSGIRLQILAAFLMMTALILSLARVHNISATRLLVLTGASQTVWILMMLFFLWQATMRNKQLLQTTSIEISGRQREHSSDYDQC